MSEATDTTQAGEDFIDASGKVWTLSHIGPLIRAAFSKWCKLRARQGVAEQRAELGEDAYREDLSLLTEEIAAGSYNWGSPLDEAYAGKAIRNILSSSDEGRVRLVQLLLAKTHGEVDGAAAMRLMDADGFEAAFRAAVRAPAAPNASPPSKPGSSTGNQETMAAPIAPTG